MADALADTRRHSAGALRLTLEDACAKDLSAETRREVQELLEDRFPSSKIVECGWMGLISKLVLKDNKAIYCHAHRRELPLHNAVSVDGLGTIRPPYPNRWRRRVESSPPCSV